MLSLTDMPREIRYQILEFCLLVEGTINPYPAPHEDKDQFAKCNRKPDIALLSINKLLNLEATDLFYKNNTWQLNSPWRLDYPPFEEDMIWKFHSGRIFHLGILMDMWDHTPDPVIAAVNIADANSLTDDYRRTFIHERCFEAALETWNWKMAVILDIIPSTLEIDMKNMYCPMGCCRNQFIDLWGRVMKSVVCVSDGPCGYWRNTGQLHANEPTTALSLIGLTKAHKRRLIRGNRSQDEESEADGAPINTDLRFKIQWRNASSNSE